MKVDSQRKELGERQFLNEYMEEELMNSSQLSIYLKKLNNKGYKEADKYKNKLLPKYIYKYYPLYDDKDDMNKKRLKSLLKEELWISSYKTFNHPLEFKSIYLDKNTMNSYGYSDKWVERVESFYNQAKSTVWISCFSKNYNNMAMWSHYANQHKGFCVKYEIFDKINFYPVIYSDKKYEGNNMILSMIDGYNKINKMERNNNINNSDYKSINKQIFKLISMMYLNYSTKTEEWSYEEEIRLIFSEKKPQTKEGKLIDYFDLGIEARKIYTGLNCSKRNESFLKTIGKRLAIESTEKIDINNKR